MENNFKPFDKVLVRDYDNQKWIPDFFLAYSGDEDNMYQMMDYDMYSQCISYIGNEDLAFTTDAPRAEKPRCRKPQDGEIYYRIDMSLGRFRVLDMKWQDGESYLDDLYESGIVFLDEAQANRKCEMLNAYIKEIL